MNWKKFKYILANSWVQSLKRPLLIAFVAAVVTAVYSLFMPNYYRSEAVILPVETKGSGSLGNLAAAAAAFGMGVSGGEGWDAHFVDILNSRILREKLLQSEFTFNQRNWRFGGDQLRKETLETYLQVGNRDRGLASLSKIIGVSRNIKSKVITLTAETSSPELSQQIVRCALANLEAFVQEKGRTRGGAKAAFAEARLRDVRKETTNAEEALRSFLNGNRNYMTSGDPAVRLLGARLEAELALHRQLLTALTLNREQAFMEEKNDIPILNILDPGNLPLEKSKPGRSIIVIFTFLLTGSAAWLWVNRELVVKLFLNNDEAQVL